MFYQKFLNRSLIVKEFCCALETTTQIHNKKQVISKHRICSQSKEIRNFYTVYQDNDEMNTVVVN